MDGGAAKSLVFTRAAARSLSRLPKDAGDLICEKLRSYARDPGRFANNVAALKGEGKRLRLRVGTWRAISTIEPDRIIVHAVGSRSTIHDQDLARDDRQNQDDPRRGDRDSPRG